MGVAIDYHWPMIDGDHTRPGGQQMELVALDLEGSGAEDDDQEAILEIALVPIVDWQPDMTTAYSTMINPKRRIPPRPWISAGLTEAALASASILPDVEPQLARRINGRYLVGHNIDVDWRLLHQRCPDVIPAGLIDTRRLVRRLDPGYRHDLSTAIQRLGLADAVTRLAVGSAPHRALWDSVAVSLLLGRLTQDAYGPDLSIGQLLKAAGVPFAAGHPPVYQQRSLLQFFE
jgi:DNA polymerase III epsilon subunit-like protein